MPRSLDGCIKCGACVMECPVLRGEGKEVFPGPRRLTMEGPRFNQELASLREPLMRCTTCGRCGSVCPSRLPIPEALIRTRALLYPTGEMPEGQRRLVENIDLASRAVLPEDGEPGLPTTGDLLFFPGCIATGRLPREVRASLDLLSATGARPYVPPEWACCGSPLEKIGDEDRLERVRRKNSELFGEVEEVVASCPGCTVQLRRAYRKQAWHMLEYLSGVDLLPGAFDPRAPKVKVALHRPCHLARVVGPHTMDMARNLLASVPGVELIEHDGEDECCGGGGGVASAEPELAVRMAKRKINSARKAGADVLLAPCPFCVVNLRQAGGLEVEELTLFLAERLGPGHKQ